MPRIAWHLRHVRGIIYIVLTAVVVAVALVSSLEADARSAWIAARQLYGLWALSLLLASMLPGPIGFVLPWFPLRAHLLAGRRALGISSFVMAIGHVACYLGPAILQDWRTIYTPGPMWITGLSIGLLSFAVIAVLAITSSDSAVRVLGPTRWKKLHQMVYLLLPAVLVHATFVGTDFGVNKGPDVTAPVDAGCLVTMLSITLAWLVLGVLRKLRMRWNPAFFHRGRGTVSQVSRPEM